MKEEETEFEFNELSQEFNFDLADFDTLEINIEHDFESRVMKPPRSKQVSERNLLYKYALDAAKTADVSEGARSFFITNGSFCFGDFIEALIVHNNFYVLNLTISTLSLNQNNVDSMENLIKGDYIKELNLIVSHYFFSHERNGLIKYLIEKLDINNIFQLAVAGSHCKIALIETECGKKIVIHGSANLRSSGNLEQFVVEENKSLFDFNNEIQNKIIDKFKTINKALRGTKLWRAMEE